MNDAMKQALMHARKCKNLIRDAKPKVVLPKEEPVVPIGYRRCRACHKVKHIDSFPLNKEYRRHVCTECCNAHARDRKREKSAKEKAIKNLTR